MKNLIYILFIAFTFSCKAQTPIKSLYEDNPDIQGAYYKDINNDLNRFTGTWLYTNGSTSLKIIIQKKSMDYNTFKSYYRDILIGEYQYIENGVEKVNTLSLFSNNNSTAYSHNIVGNILLKKNNFIPCNDCLEFEKRVSLNFSDPLRASTEGLEGRIVIKRADVGATQKIKITLVQTGNIIIVNDTPPAYTSFNIPWGEYTLTKVP